MVSNNEVLVPDYDESWKPEAIEQAFTESRDVLPMLLSEMDASDSKTVAVFTLASAVIGLGPALSRQAPQSFDEWILWVIAAIAWFVSVYHAFLAYKPGEIRRGPDPLKLLSPDWMTLSKTEYQANRLRYMAKTADMCFKVIDEKADHLQKALIATGVEVAFTAAALLR
jgi:hypothetical protein